jgi:hypothetical protein
MNWRAWAALAGAGAVLVSGLGFLGRQVMPAASRPAFVDPCGPTSPGTGRTVKRLPAPVRLPGRLGPILSATVTESVLLLDVGEPPEDGPNPQWLMGLDPGTLATRWWWPFPAEPGPATEGISGDSWVAVAGDVALAVSGVYGSGGGPLLHAVDLRTGRPRWTERFPAGSRPAAVVVDRCLVVISAMSGNGTLGLWGMDPATGRVLWQNGPAEELVCTVPARRWLYALSGGHLVRYSLADGKVTAVRAPLKGCGPVWLSGDRLVDRFTGRWYAVDWSRPAVTPTGQAPVQIKPNAYPEFSPIGDVLVVDDHGKVTVHDRGGGTLLWQDDGTGRAISSQPPGSPRTASSSAGARRSPRRSAPCRSRRWRRAPGGRCGSPRRGRASTSTRS